MKHALTETRPGRLAALAGFVQDVYAPGLHIGFAAAWFCALDGGFALLSDQPAWRLMYMPVGVASYFLALFYLRVLDEWKDLDYDKVHNPGRPLVRGTVSVADIYWFLAGSAAVVFAVHLLFPGFSGRSAWPLTIIGLDLGYGLLLAGVERVSRAVRDSVFLNLAVTYPVNAALSIYAYAAFIGRFGGNLELKPILLIAAFAIAFLHYEFARKTAWPQHAKPGKRLYSSVIGARMAMALTIMFAAAAIGVAVALFAPITPMGLAPLLALLPVLAGARRFRAQGNVTAPVKASAPMTPFAMMFLTIYYLAIVAAALTAGVAL